MDRSLALGLVAFALTASLLAIPAIAGHHDANHVGEHRAAGQPLTREQMTSRIAERFAAADADSSGTIDRSEAEARHAARQAERQARHFTRIDTNGDGEISLAERDAARARRPERRRVSRSDMIVEDRNMRARLTPEELAPLQSGTEQAAPADSRLAARITRRNAAWENADADGNGALNRTEFEAMASARHERRAERGMSHFDRMDSDEDGVLSLAEISARSLARFEQADANDDGIVTRAERHTARQTMRAERRTRR